MSCYLDYEVMAEAFRLAKDMSITSRLSIHDPVYVGRYASDGRVCRVVFFREHDTGFHAVESSVWRGVESQYNLHPYTKYVEERLGVPAIEIDLMR